MNTDSGTPKTDAVSGLGGSCATCVPIDHARTLERENADLRQSMDFYQRRCVLLQKWQSQMRDPERTIVCDILANGCTLNPPRDRYAIPDADLRAFTDRERAHLVKDAQDFAKQAEDALQSVADLRRQLADERRLAVDATETIVYLVAAVGGEIRIGRDVLVRRDYVLQRSQCFESGAEIYKTTSALTSALTNPISVEGDKP